MCIQIRNVLIRLMVYLCLFGSVCAAESLEAEIQQLRSVGGVAGSAVGFAAAPGAFFTLSKVFVEKGTEHDFLRLAEDQNPVVRSMGLLCLAQHKTSLNTLREHLTDTSLISYCSGGCVVWTITVGDFVRKLLNNANHLDYSAPSLPVLSKEDLMGLDIEILSKDSTKSFHDEAGESLFNAFEKRKITLRLHDLKKYAPNMETYEIIKAIGRIEVSDMAQPDISERNGLLRMPITRKSPDSPFKQELREALQSTKENEMLPGIEPHQIAREQREFLISCMRNRSLDEASTLAAASALTRDSNETTLSAIESEQTRLNGLTQGDWGDRFQETLQNRAVHEKLIKTIRDRYGRRGIEIVDDSVIRAFSNSHPLALPDLTDDAFFRLGPHYGKLCNIVGDSIVEMSKNLEKFDQPWNTYSDTAYALNFVMMVRKGNLLFDRIFTPDRRSQIEKNVQKAIENHFEGKSNRWNAR